MNLIIFDAISLPFDATLVPNFFRHSADICRHFVSLNSAAVLLQFDARCNTSVLGGDSSPGDAKCFTIQNDICNCLDVAQGKTDADMHKCLSCDVGPPEDNCTIADTCDSAFGGTYDWVSCGMPDWTCTCGMSDPAPYGPDNTL